ncbi:N-6 DNA methylase [Nonomuraea sp. NPDC059007]|uniref:N-6 DNA methylase n=1 Tax=Nonomuraea sp. NPDC059007 TaxID=3346692 RepID=UPI003682C3CA
MHDSATVAAADIARLAGVGRAAVSNWRRRFNDFPVPVGGTSSNPLFALSHVEEWLRRQGKIQEIPEEERVWQQIKASVEDLHLGHAVGHAGAFLVFLDQASHSWRKLAKKPDEELISHLTQELSSLDMPTEHVSVLEARLLRAIADLASAQSAAHIFDFMYERYLEAHSRRIATVSTHVAQLMVALADAANGIVFDPSCNLGSVLMNAAEEGAEALYGQERESHAAQISAARLRLHGHRGHIKAGDAVRHDAFASLQADAVACIPPFGERNWGYDELTSDVRWLYGLPPRGEPELPWVQHGLYHLKPGRHMAVVMPPTAANRRSGRRIRAQLLRTGTLRAVIALPVGTAPGALSAPHLWVLRRPSPGDPVASHVLMLDLADVSEDQLTGIVLERWHAFAMATDTNVEGAVAVIDLLDDEVDLTPARQKGVLQSTSDERDFKSLLNEMSGSVDQLQRAVTRLRAIHATHVDIPKTTVAEQVRAGAITILQAPKSDSRPGKLTLLTVADVVENSLPSGRIAPFAGMVMLEVGDVVVPAGGRTLVAKVVETGGDILGQGLYAFRVDRERIDPACLAAFLRLAGASTPSRGQSGTSRADIRRIEIPRLPLDEQRRIGEAFKVLEQFEEAIRQASSQAETLMQLGLREIMGAQL